MNFDTRENTEQKMRSKLGFNGSGIQKGVDVLNRMDYVTDYDYLNACAKYDLEHSSPEYQRAYREAERTYTARQEERQRKVQDEAIEKNIKEMQLSRIETDRAREAAKARAEHDWAMGKVDNIDSATASYAKEEAEKIKRSKAINAAFNDMIRAELDRNRMK